MSPTVLLILLLLFAAVNWSLFGWLFAWWLKRSSARDRMPLWPIFAGAVLGPVFVLVSGLPAILGIG